MIKAVIIDDEKDARFLLRNLVEKKFHSRIEVVGEADDVAPGVELIKSCNPDLVFLDIQMKKGTGFDLLKKFDKINFEVIFITAYNQHAIEAFKFSAVDYLLKPIKLNELNDAVNKFDDLLNMKKGGDKRANILIENYGKRGEIQKLVISNIEGFRILEIGTILRLEGDRNYTHFILENGQRITTSKSLKEYETILFDYGFFRIHQSTIVSLRHISGFIRADGGFVEMIDGTTHKVSRSRKNDFLERFN